MKYHLILFFALFIVQCQSRLYKRVFLNWPNLGVLNSAGYNKGRTWKVATFTTASSPYTIGGVNTGFDTGHHMAYIVPLNQDGSVSKVGPGFIVDLYIEPDTEVTFRGSVITAQFGVQISQYEPKIWPPTSNSGRLLTQVGEDSAAFQDTAYNIIGRVYEKCNTQFGIDNPFPPTEESDANAKVAKQMYFRLGTNCQTVASTILSSIPI